MNTSALFPSFYRARFWTRNPRCAHSMNRSQISILLHWERIVWQLQPTSETCLLSPRSVWLAYFSSHQRQFKVMIKEGNCITGEGVFYKASGVFLLQTIQRLWFSTGILCYFCEFDDQNVRNELNNNFFGVPSCAKDSNHSARPLGHRCLYPCLGMGTVQCDTGCAKIVVNLRGENVISTYLRLFRIHIILSYGRLNRKM